MGDVRLYVFNRFAMQHIFQSSNSNTGPTAGPQQRTEIMNIARSLTNWRKYRQTITELGRMSDRELRDLGIGREDIRRVARSAVHG